jgi:hypothetical protein
VSDHALLLSPNLNTPPEAVDPRLVELKQTVLDTVISLHSKRNYANALDHLFAFAASRPLTRALLMEWRAGMEKDSPSTVNVRLSAMRKLVNEARRNGMLASEEVANLTDARISRREEHVLEIGSRGRRPRSCSRSRTVPR